MKKLVIFISLLTCVLIGFAQEVNYFVEKPDYFVEDTTFLPMDKAKYYPSDFGSGGIGLARGRKEFSMVFSCNCYHWDFMFNVILYNGKDKGSYGQHYSSVMSSYHYSGQTYLGHYRKNLGGLGMYNGYVFNQFAFGVYLGYEECETGETYANPNHVSTWDEIYSVNYTIHTKFVYGLYVRWYVAEGVNLFYSYKFNTPNHSTFGIVFHFFH